MNACLGSANVRAWMRRYFVLRQPELLLSKIKAEIIIYDPESGGLQFISVNVDQDIFGNRHIAMRC